MRSPYVSSQVKLSGSKAVAASNIVEGSIIEICPVLPITSRIAITMSKSQPSIEKKLILDRSVIDREYTVFAELGELELEKRLDSGQITHDEYRRILSSKVDMNSLLDVKSHMLPLGYGLFYQISDFPNCVREYSSVDKLCTFRAVQYIPAGTELTYFI